MSTMPSRQQFILLSGLVMFFSSFYLAYNPNRCMNEDYCHYCIDRLVWPCVSFGCFGTTLTSTFTAGNRVRYSGRETLVEDVEESKTSPMRGVRISKLSFAYDDEQIWTTSRGHSYQWCGIVEQLR